MQKWGKCNVYFLLHDVIYSFLLPEGKINQLLSLCSAAAAVAAAAWII